LEPYTKIDFALAAKQLSDEEYTQLRQEAQSAYEEHQFLNSELDGFMEKVKQDRTKLLANYAKEAHEVLQTTIPNWSKETYNEIRTFAVDAGLPAEEVNTFVNPVVIQLLYKAMQYEKGKKVATVKKAKAPKKAVKTNSVSASPNASKGARASNAMQKHRAKGDVDSAADAFLARWGVE